MKNILLLLSIIILFAACEKTISIAPVPYSDKLNIQCALEPDSLPTLYLYRTVPFFDPAILASQLFVRNAIVEISSTDGTDRLAPDSSYNRLKCEFQYFFKGKNIVKSNKTYSLKISWNGQTFNATTTTSQQAVKVDSVGYTQTFSDVYGEHEGVIVYFNGLAGQSNFYRFEMLRTVDSTQQYASSPLNSACLGKDVITVLEIGRSVYDGTDLGGQQNKLVIEPAFTHRKGLVGSVRIQTIDKATYSFFNNIDRQKLAQLNPFVEPIFVQSGQFGDAAIGYFGALVRSQPVRFVFPE
jgi:Domain of unknown function (DUF4249)